MSEGATGTTAPSRRISLAEQASFALGLLTVEPATRQIARGDASETLEPRVMQVLVALASARGSVVSRDELIERCWDGRIVTDDAINRVLSRLRQVAAGIGGGSFAIETIARVGYRLRADEPARVVLPFPLRGEPAADSSSPEQPDRPVASRRMWLAGGVGLVAVGGTALVSWAPWRHRVAPLSRQLTERGQAMVREGFPGQTRQAVTYFEKAVVADPRNAEAWGQLALAYSHMLNGFDPAEQASLPGRIRSAAARAEELDPGNGDAALALLYMTPLFGRWAEKERGLRAVIARRPRHWLAHGRLAMLLYQVGRVEDGVKNHERALAIEPVLPVPHGARIWALGALGRVQEGDAVMALANDRWPGHPMIWNNSFHHLLYSGRAESAAAYVRDPRVRPDTVPAGLVERLAQLAEAVASGDAALRAAAARAQSALIAESPGAIPQAAGALVLLGAVDEGFEALGRYLLGPQPAGPPMPRSTEMLFAPPWKALGGDPRYRALISGSGLAAYWRASGSRPDP